MSSYTSSSESHRRFVFWLLFSVAGLFALGVYLQPLNKYSGLTRIGSYSEREFGWNKPQLTFPRTKLEFPASAEDSGQYGSYHDVVVLGDSFSRIWPELQWQNHLAATTGWSVATLNINKIRLGQVLASQEFHDHPPRVLIVESVERYLTGVLKRNTSGCGKPDFDTFKAQSSLQINRGEANTAFTMITQFGGHLPGTTQRVERERAWIEIKLGYVRGYIWNSLLRNLLGDAHTDAAKVALAKDAPFSSVNKHAMLVYKEDFRKVEWWREMGMPELGCRIEKMRKQVEANGQTRFVLMVAPDKLTAYADFLSDKGLRDISALFELSVHLPEVMPRLDLALTSAINNGEQDVYLPDDTHWGSSGNQIAAETLLTFLRNP